MIRPLIALAGLTLSAAIAAPQVVPQDYASIPPEASEVHKTLSASGMKLDALISAAQEAAGGLASQASIDPASGQAEVIVYTAEKKLKVAFGRDGKVLSQTEVPRFPGAPVSGDWTETDSGLKYYDMVVGDGAMPPSKSSTVRVHYTGWLLDGKQFDSSVERGEPIDFPLNRVIAGWTEGVASMKVGGKRKLIIPSNLGYGARGNSSIPGGATLVFDVELLDVVK